MLRGGTMVGSDADRGLAVDEEQATEARSAMRSSKRESSGIFGMKAHVGVDAKSGLVHTAGVTTGSVPTPR